VRKDERARRDRLDLHATGRLMPQRGGCHAGIERHYGQGDE
jgi:hypothetical protein